MYMKPILLTSMLQFSKYEFIHPIGGKLSVYGSQKETEVRWYSVIFLSLHFHGSDSVSIQKAPKVTLSHSKDPQGPVYQSLQWANWNEPVSPQVKVVCLFRDDFMWGASRHLGHSDGKWLKRLPSILVLDWTHLSCVWAWVCCVCFSSH